MGNKKKVIYSILTLIALFLLVKYSGMSYLFQGREKMEEYIKSLGVLGPLVYILLFILTAVTCLSALSLTVVGGLLFGPLLGVVYAITGATLGLMTSFLIARYLAKDYVKEKFGSRDIYKKIEKGVNEEGWIIIAITRLLPIFPYGVQNYVYGLTSISFFKYSILSMIFMIPGTSVYVLLAGAVASGDSSKAIKLSIVASVVFLGITIFGKKISNRYSEKKTN